MDERQTLLSAAAGAVLLAVSSCGNGSAQPPPASPEPAPAPVVSVAAPEPIAPADESAALPPPREPAAPPDDRVTVESSEDIHVEIERDAGYFSFRARTVRDGGFSFRLQGSMTVSGDGGSVHIQIGGDGGAP
jgi:hypothetical protein